MWKCPGCDELNQHDTVICASCGYYDIGWESTLRLARREHLRLVRSTHSTVDAAARSTSAGIAAAIERTIPVTSFTEPGEYAFELLLFDRAIKQSISTHPNRKDKVKKASQLAFDYRYIAKDFDASVVIDEYTGDVLPATVGVTALMDARRAIEVARMHYQTSVELVALLPPRSHPVTHFLHEAGLIPPGVRIELSPSSADAMVPFGALETIVPAYDVIQSQLPSSAFDRLSALATAGRIEQDYHRELRKAVMEIADNGCRHGDGRCTVAVYLRNEGSTGSSANLRLPLSERDARKIHLFVLCYTVGPTFAQKIGLDDEREAVHRILSRDASASVGGGLGLGLGGALWKARDSAQGTILVSSGRYTRVDSPNRMVREWTSETGIVLPGVSICLLVPLANVAALSIPYAS